MISACRNDLGRSHCLPHGTWSLGVSTWSLGVTWGHLGSPWPHLPWFQWFPMVPNGSQWFPMVPNSHLLSHHGLRNQHHHWHHSLNPGLLAKTWVAQSPGIAATLQESNTLLLKMLINAQKLSILSWFTY